MTDVTVVTPKALFAANSPLARVIQEIRHNCHICRNMRYLNSVLRDKCQSALASADRSDLRQGRSTLMPTFRAGASEFGRRRSREVLLDQDQAKTGRWRGGPRLSVHDATSSPFAGGCLSAKDAVAKYRYTPLVGKIGLDMPQLGQASSGSLPLASLQLA